MFSAESQAESQPVAVMPSHSTLPMALRLKCPLQ